MPESMLLTTLLLLPIGGAVVVCLLGLRMARVVTMLVMLAGLVLALTLFNRFDGAGASTATAINLTWITALGVNLRFAIDGYNVYLVLLSALLFPVVLACAWHTDEGRNRLYLCLMLALEAGLLGTFLSQNLLLFFVLWEAVLVPMVLLILVFGGEQRRRAALTFFLYTMAGSVLLLAAVIALGAEALQQTGRWAFDYDVLYALTLSPGKQLFVFVAVTLACAVKSPLFPFHAWLPLAYAEASPSGTALLAGVLSKMGAFGFIKLALPLCPDVAPAMGPALSALAVASILYGAVIALRQQNFKLLVAYASLSHMGYIVLGIFSFQATGLHGAMVQLLSHGVTVAGLFLLLGLLEQRRGNAYLELQSLATIAPRLAVACMLFVLASLALPLSSGFTAEFMVLLGAFSAGLETWRTGAGSAGVVTAVLASGGVVLGATYMLRFARTLVFGDGTATAPAASLPDLRPREALALAPLLALILWLGVWPAPFLHKVVGMVAERVEPTVLAPPVLVASDVAAPTLTAADVASQANPEASR